MVVLPQPTAFEWDGGNAEKNFHSHNVGWAECEEVFFSERKLLLDDVLHSGAEARYILLGETSGKRQIFIAFTIRDERVRIISARPADKRERTIYESIFKKVAKI